MLTTVLRHRMFRGFTGMGEVSSDKVGKLCCCVGRVRFGLVQL